MSWTRDVRQFGSVHVITRPRAFLVKFNWVGCRGWFQELDTPGGSRTAREDYEKITMIQEMCTKQKFEHLLIKSVFSY